MARRSSQNGCAFKRGKKNNRVWVGRWRQTVILTDGSSKRILRSEVLGKASAIEQEATKRNCPVSEILEDLLRARIRKSGERVDSSEHPTTFSEFIEEKFKPEILPNLKYATRQSYAGLLKTHLVPHLGPKSLRGVSRSEIQLFLNRKLESGLSWETVNHLRWLVSAVLELALTDKAIEENPVRGEHGVKMPERFAKRPHSALTAEELGRLIANLTGSARLAVILAASLGLRIGEILALRWGKIDFTRGTMLIDETCYKGHFGQPKTAKSVREIPVAPAVIEKLILHRGGRSRSAVELVFATANGTPLSADNLRKRQLADGCKAAKLARIDWHALRHTHASLLHSRGVPLKIAQAQLGHARMTTTCEVYTHVVGNDQREAIDDLARQLFPTVPKSEEKQTDEKMGSTLIQ